MSKRLRIPDYLGHIDEAISKIGRYVGGMDWETFSADTLRQDATIRNLEIIGEAARTILSADPKFIEKYPEFELGEAVGMRNVLIHGYHAVQLDYVWDTVQNDLPDLKQRIGKLLLRLRVADSQSGEKE